MNKAATDKLVVMVVSDDLQCPDLIISRNWLDLPTVSYLFKEKFYVVIHQIENLV